MLGVFVVVRRLCLPLRFCVCGLIRPQTEEEEDINSSQTEEGDDKIGTKISPKEILSDDDNVSVTRTKRKTTSPTIPSLNQTRKIKVSRRRQPLRHQNRKRKRLCQSNPLLKQGRQNTSLPSKLKTNPRAPPDPKRRKQR